MEYQVPVAQAAELLGVSERHARRLLAAYRRDGAAALAHGNRGRCPHNAIPVAQAAGVMEMATQRYEGANHTHFTELLREREGIDLSRPTVRRILTGVGIGSPRSRRSPQHRFRRQRMPQAGMLVQLDGSHHAWLEDRGPKFALLLAVDDATGVVVNAVFRTGEDTRGYFMLLEDLIEDWGIPLALYSDRHAVFKHNARKPEMAAEATQFTPYMRGYSGTRSRHPIPLTVSPYMRGYSFPATAEAFPLRVSPPPAVGMKSRNTSNAPGKSLGRSHAGKSWNK